MSLIKISFRDVFSDLHPLVLKRKLEERKRKRDIIGKHLCSFPINNFVAGKRNEIDSIEENTFTTSYGDRKHHIDSIISSNDDLVFTPGIKDIKQYDFAIYFEGNDGKVGSLVTFSQQYTPEDFDDYGKIKEFSNGVFILYNGNKYSMTPGYDFQSINENKKIVLLKNVRKA